MLNPLHRRSFQGLGICACAFVLCVSLAQAQEAAPTCPTATRKDNVVDVLHGVQIADPYRWLEDQQSSETRAWIEAEDKCSGAVLDAAPGRGPITKRLTELMKVDMFELPVERGDNYFFARRRADQDLYVIYTRQGLTGKDEVLIDPHPLSADHSTSVNLLHVSRDGSLAAYGVRAGGQDEVTVRFINTVTKQSLPDELPSGNYFSVCIEPSNKGAYYTLRTAKGTRVFHHAMGTAASADQEVFGQGYGTEKILAVQLSEEGRYLLITVIFGSGSTRTELYYKDVQTNAPVRPIVNDLDSLFYGEIHDEELYVATNWNAPNWHVYKADLGHPSRASWKKIISETDTAIDYVSYASGKIFVAYVRNAASQLKVFATDGTPAGDVELPGLGAVSGARGEWTSHQLFYSFESFNVSASIYRYDIAKKSSEVWTAPNVPLDPNSYVVEQVWYLSKDGTRIPMFLFYKKGTPRDGDRPVWLTGYGGFDVNNTPYFYAPAVAWADTGGIYALANLRGGGEFGEAWHHAGMLEKKQNVFDDFIAAAEWLIKNNYTSSQKLAIEGESNGGLLVGAALTQRPELFRAVVCEYPLLDMLRYQKFMKGPFWIPEYGSADDAAQFKYLYAYSPYQNVKGETKYPAVLFITGDGDTRVAPLHARKMAARLQAATASNQPILLRYDTKSGHSGGRPLSKQIEEAADILTFLSMELGASASPIPAD
jgi:prolyl oligopeptidase